MTRLLYSLFMGLAQPLLRRKLQKRGRQEPGYLAAIEERFGHYAASAPAPHGMTVWVHAVSLGETRACAVLVSRLRQQLPGMRLLLTHGTATGRAEGLSLLQPGDLQSWQPWDTPAAVQRFLAHFKPAIGILMETEIWPNLVAGCQRRGVPLVLANARLSDKSLRQAQRLAWLARPAYRSLTAVWAQTQADAQRLTQLGAPVQGVFGNLKFDATPNPEQLATGRTWGSRADRPVVMFASSREGEEETLLQFLASFKPLGAWAAERSAQVKEEPTQWAGDTEQNALPPRLPARVDGAQVATKSIANDIQWLIVPRHPQRFEAVAALIKQHGFGVSRRSDWGDGPVRGEAADASTIWLGDSLGEMALYYGLADVALLGGSFEPLGGQNLIEAAACACPVVMGPHTFNFAEAAELAEAAGAALRAPSLADAVAVAHTLVSDPAAHAVRVNAAAGFSRAHRGAVEKTVAAVAALLGQQAVDAL